MKLHYNTEINERKEIAKNWATKTGNEAIFNRRENTWEVGEVTFRKDGIIEGPITCQQVDELSNLVKDWEFADQDSKNEYYEMGEREEEAQEIEDKLSKELMVTYPKDLFTPQAQTNLENLIKCKEHLIKKSLGVDNLDVQEEITGEGSAVLAFHWFHATTDPDEINAYNYFIASLCLKAINSRSIDPTEYPVDDEQFDYSRFLHRIGMVGAKYKKQRKILMRNLEGSTWRKAVEQRKARRAQAELAEGA